MSGVEAGAPGEIDARALSPTIPLDVIIGDPALEEGPAIEASLVEWREGGDESTFNKSRVVEATRSVRVAGLDEDDSGANGSEAATAEGDETGIEGADISADDDEDDESAARRARVFEERR